MDKEIEKQGIVDYWTWRGAKTLVNRVTGKDPAWNAYQEYLEKYKTDKLYQEKAAEDFYNFSNKVKDFKKNAGSYTKDELRQIEKKLKKESKEAEKKIRNDIRTYRKNDKYIERQLQWKLNGSAPKHKPSYPEPKTFEQFYQEQQEKLKVLQFQANEETTPEPDYDSLTSTEALFGSRNSTIKSRRDRYEKRWQKHMDDNLKSLVDELELNNDEDIIGRPLTYSAD